MYELVFKDQPVFCNCLKILTTEGLPESHFYLQFPSSGFSAIKNLKEPQKEGQLAHTQTVMSNYSASGNHWLFLCNQKMTVITCRWLQGWEVLQPRASPDSQCRIQQGRPSTPPVQSSFTRGCVSSACPAPHVLPRSTNGLLRQPRGHKALQRPEQVCGAALRLHSVISYWVLWQLSTHSWQSLFNPLI